MNNVFKAPFGKGVACDTLSLSEAPFGKGSSHESG